MIEINKTEVHGWETAIRGMRNSWESWAKSDSGWCMGDSDPDLCAGCKWFEANFGHCTHPALLKEEIDGQFRVGKKDFTLMVKLANAGPDHGKFLRMITVTADILAPLYWWKEFDTYKVGTVANSCSTMHKIHAKEFTLDDFSHEHMDIRALNLLDEIIETLNRYRDLYNKGFKGVPGDDILNFPPRDKTFWWQMIQLLPSSYNQRRTVQLNYAVLRHIYGQRQAHKLDEWREFCAWAETLPYGKELIVPKE